MKNLLCMVLALMAVGLAVWNSALINERNRATSEFRQQEAQAVKGRMLFHAVYEAIALGDEIRRFTDKEGKRCLSIRFAEARRQLTYCVSEYGLESSATLYAPEFK